MTRLVTLLPDDSRPSPDCQLRATSADETRALGARLGRALCAGDVVALVGPLGSGKTTFAQGLALGLEVPPERHVASPTFALVNEHPGRVPFLHADLYRLRSEAELAELGLDEAFGRVAAALEWADRYPEALPSDCLTIRFETLSDGSRQMSLKSSGSRSLTLLRAIAAEAGQG